MSLRSRALLGLGLLFAVALPGPVLGQSPSVALSPSASPVASSVPWMPALDASGTPLAAGGPVTPVAILGGDTAVVAAVVDATGTTRVWATPDGTTWSVTDPATFGGRRIDGLAVTGGRWLAWSQPVPADGADLAMWTSRTMDLATWTSVPSDALVPFSGATLATVTGGANGFIAVGARRVAGSPEARLWTSEFGASWRERPQFAVAYPGTRLTGQAPMGRTLIATGTNSAGRPAAWVGWSSTSYVWRKTPASLPRGAEPLAIVAGRDAGLMVARGPGDGATLLRSIDAWTWEPTDGPPGFDRVAERTAWAGSPTWIVADTVGRDGAHELRASVDALDWAALPATGLPTDGAVPLLAIATDTVVALTPAGIWARPIGLEPPPPAAGTGTRFDGDAPGADPPLRPPVTARWKDRPRWTPTDAPDAVNTKDGVTLELWLPDRAFRPGEWLPAHIRFTNRGPDAITVGCEPGGASGNVSGFWPSGRTWTGNAAIFKRRVLKANAWESVWFRPARTGSLACPGGDVGRDYAIAPGESHELDLFALPASRIGDQPLPSGRMPVRAALTWQTAADRGRGRTIAVVGSVRLIGPAWRWPSPGQLVDAALEDPFFGDWIARQAPPREWSNTTFHTSQHWIYTEPVGYEGAAPDGTVHLGLFAGSWSPVVGWYGQVLLDPWTGTVLGSGAEE